MARLETDASLEQLWILFNTAGWVTAHVASRFQCGSPHAFVAIPMYEGRRSLNTSHAVLVRPFGRTTRKIRLQPLEQSLQIHEPTRVHGPVKDALSYPNVIYWGNPFNRRGGKLRGEPTALHWAHFVTHVEYRRVIEEVGPQYAPKTEPNT